MPLYEYVCQSCGKKTEVIQRVGAKRFLVCPHCGGSAKKAFSAPAIQFKGTGFYVTDYARGQSGAADKSGRSEAAEKRESGEKGESGEKSDSGEKGRARAKNDVGEKSGGDKGASEKKESREKDRKKESADGKKPGKPRKGD